VVKGAYNTLTLRLNGKAESYDCELNYTFKCTYKIVKDTLYVTEPDDSHSEDGGKVVLRRYKYLIHNGGLFCVSSGELINGKWLNKKVSPTKAPDWKRVK